jgi:hypothetical protein
VIHFDTYQNHSKVIANGRSAAQKTLRSIGTIDPGECQVRPTRSRAAAYQATSSLDSVEVGHPDTTGDTRGRLVTIGDNRSGFALNQQRNNDLTIAAQLVE